MHENEHTREAGSRQPAPVHGWLPPLAIEASSPLPTWYLPVESIGEAIAAASTRHPAVDALQKFRQNFSVIVVPSLDDLQSVGRW